MDYLKVINEKYPIRKTEEQKDVFRKYVLASVSEKGIDARVEKLDKHNNVVIGNPQTAKTVFTAHYDTPCASLFPNLMMPRSKVLCYLYMFAIIFLFLAVALIPAVAIGLYALESEVVYACIFLVLYFGLYFLALRTFTNKHNANDNTSGVATLLTVMDSLTQEELKSVAFIFFDDEEKGLLGAKAYSKRYKTEMQDKLLINFDCVANGREILFIAKPKAEQNPFYSILKESFVGADGFNVEYYPLKGSMSNSDYKRFEQGVCCVACKKNKKGLLYTPYIHTRKDVVADSKNIEFLARSTVGFVKKIV